MTTLEFFQKQYEEFLTGPSISKERGASVNKEVVLNQIRWKAFYTFPIEIKDLFVARLSVDQKHAELIALMNAVTPLLSELELKEVEAIREMLAATDKAISALS